MCFVSKQMQQSSHHAGRVKTGRWKTQTGEQRKKEEKRSGERNTDDAAVQCSWHEQQQQGKGEMQEVSWLQQSEEKRSPPRQLHLSGGRE